MEAARSTYLLWTRFSMPTHGGSRDAVSVSSDDGKKLLSAYTLMVDLIIMQIWALIVIVAVSAFMRNTHSPNVGAASAAIWNSKESPFSVLKVTARYFLHMKRRRDRWYALLWIFVATSLIAVNYILSIFVPGFVELGNAAPVNPKSIFVPKNEVSAGGLAIYQAHALGVPSSLRAAGSVDVLTPQRVTMGDPVTRSGVYGTVKQISYAYDITGVEFGLQHAADLALHVEGSCITEYTWLNSSGFGADGVWVDKYQLFGEPSPSYMAALSIYDGRPPIAYIRLGPPGTKSNTSFSIAVSSAGRFSYTPGRDPLYVTNSTDHDPNGPGYTVMTQRPILSCWQNDIWSYQGHKSATSDLSSLPGLNMPAGLTKYFFERFLGIPMIVTLGSELGGRAIQSASTAVEQTFDAGIASMESDLQHLVAAAYVASKNILIDTTTISSNLTNLTNIAIDPKTGALYPGANDFIITSSGITTLSVKVLIIIPVVLVLLFLIVTVLTIQNASWNKVQALEASILYSCLEEQSAKLAAQEHSAAPRGTWNRKSEMAYYSADVEHPAAVTPEFEQKVGLSWALRPHSNEK